MSVKDTTLALGVHDLSVDFGGFRALDKVSLSVPQSERRAIIGPNGAGKTTLLQAVSGALRTSQGRIELFGEDVSRLAEHERARCGIGRTFQITKLFPRLSIMDNLRLAFFGMSRSKWVIHRPVERHADVTTQVREYLAQIGLEHRGGEFVANLSHGEQRQVELAVALATGPRILLLDEPAAGLAPAERGAMQKLITEVPRTTTIVMIEHNMDLVFAMADVVTVLHQGRVLAEGTPASIRENSDVRRVYFSGG